MITVDTNIIVRLLTQDDEAQFQKSLRLFQEHNILILETVILETEWVLRFAYQFTSNDICQAFRNLFGLPNVDLADAPSVAQALNWHEQGLDFADALHLAKGQQHTTFYTFDEKFVRKAKSLTSCEVKQPE